MLDQFARLLPRARFDSRNYRFAVLLKRILSEFPEGPKPIESVTEIEMKRRGEMEGLVGLTTYCCVRTEVDPRRPKESPNQRITFYSELLDEISDKSAMGVIAHELAHAWLNEHVSPEDSKNREAQADELARSWGYGEYLDALAAETEPV